MNKIFTQLDGFRGFAALYIMLGHYLNPLTITPPLLHTLLSFGQEAVVFFFMLSGFLTFYSYCKNPQISVRSYIAKKIKRIYPLWLICLAVTLMVDYASGALSDDWLLVFIGNVCNLQDASGLKPGVLVPTLGCNMVLWYMSYQWWFYIIFILMTKFSSGNIMRSSFILTFAGMVTYAVFPNVVSIHIWYFVIFLAGMWLFEIYRKKVTFSFVPYMAFIVMMTVWGLLNIGTPLESVGIHPLLEARHISFAMVIISIYFFMKRMKLHSIPGIKMFRWAAPFSYSLYIFQMPVLRATEHVLGCGLWQTCMAIVLNIIFSWAMETRVSKLWIRKK